ncbi:transcriptional regulator [Bordetella sp. J329]|uniref:helix-turn-helix domain-containing protein n=1 Tax=Kerstersia gyiorum TaxID=206506 RepID=UPI000FDBD0DC|nr:helix-turn-helix transcriptional regulator [Kerstersia gyiorum]AZV93653.1 transcriptional regulator [Bordetella sp. J329]MCH4271891.1 helix-turn-helix domain-containing protein [Kerstersia gyiorum]MCI1227727.1 helix-turn-helix domain-containing protein [Kerstersia gyiorum]
MLPASYPLLTPGQLGATLQAARKAAGLTQSELASRIGLSQPRVSHLELHAQEMNVAQLLAWCATLGLELSVATRGSEALSAASATDW